MQRQGGGQRGGGCGCGMPLMGGGGSNQQAGGLMFANGGYRKTARNSKYLKQYRAGKSIGFTMLASLKAKGLIPRTSRKNRGRKVVGPKYKTRRNRQ